jgi:hypothetical protein
MQFKELFGFDFIKDFNATPIELKLATDFYDEYIQYKDDKQPAEEYELVLHWAEDLKLDKNFELVNELEYRTQRTDIDNLIAEGKFEITQGWSDKTLGIEHIDVCRSIHSRLSSMILECDKSLTLGGLSTVQRLPPGTELKSHVDQNTDPSIRYAAILYINDDYNSGEIFFKNREIALRPNSRDLLFFPGNSEYEHGVKTVSDGPVRYVVVGFVKEIGFYERNRY